MLIAVNSTESFSLTQMMTVMVMVSNVRKMVSFIPTPRQTVVVMAWSTAKPWMIHALLIFLIVVAFATANIVKFIRKYLPFIPKSGQFVFNILLLKR